MSAFSRIVGIVVIVCSTCSGCQTPERMAESVYRQGVRARTRGQPQQAAQHFQAALTHDPQHASAHLELGIMACRDHRYPAAIKHLLRAIEYGVTSYKPYAYIGYAYERSGPLNLAEHYYKQALRRGKALIDVRLRLAEVLETRHKWLEAATVLQEVIRLQPDHPKAMLLKARIGLLRQSPSPEVNRALADVYISHGYIRKGTAAYQQAEPINPREPESLARFGLFCARRGQFRIASVYLSRAVQLGLTEQPDIRAALGVAYEKLGEVREAIEEYRTVVKLRPDSRKTQLRLADLLEQTGQTAEAADVLEAVFRNGQAEDVNALWQRILRLRGEASLKTVVHLKRAGGYELVELTINDNVPATMLVDTQARYTIISEDLAQQLNILLSTHTSDVQFLLNGQRAKAPLVNLASVKVGGMEVRNIPTLIYDLSEAEQIDGVLGMSFLKHFQVEIRDDQQLFVLTKLYS